MESFLNRSKVGCCLSADTVEHVFGNMDKITQHVRFALFFFSQLHIQTHTHSPGRVPSATDKSMVAQRNIENQLIAIPWILFLLHSQWTCYECSILCSYNCALRTSFSLFSLSGFWNHAHAIFNFVLFPTPLVRCTQIPRNNTVASDWIH